MASGETPAGTDDPEITQREMNQGQRIQQWINRGHLTPRETGRLEAPNR